MAACADLRGHLLCRDHPLALLRHPDRRLELILLQLSFLDHALKLLLDVQGAVHEGLDSLALELEALLDAGLWPVPFLVMGLVLYEEEPVLGLKASIGHDRACNRMRALISMSK